MALSAIERLSAVEFAATLAASRIFGMTVLATAQESELIFQIFSDKSERMITWGELAKQAKRHIRHEIDKEIMRREALEDAERLALYRGTIVDGTLVDLRKDGTWSVLTMFNTGPAGYIQHYSEFPLAHQPVPERKKYERDLQLKFMVSSVVPVRLGTAASIALVKLSRSAKIFPVLLAEQIDRQATRKANLRVVRRFPGFTTELAADKAIPKKIVASLSTLLGERITFAKTL